MHVCVCVHVSRRWQKRASLIRRLSSEGWLQQVQTSYWCVWSLWGGKFQKTCTLCPWTRTCKSFTPRLWVIATERPLVSSVHFEVDFCWFVPLFSEWTRSEAAGGWGGDCGGVWSREHHSLCGRQRHHLAELLPCWWVNPETLQLGFLLLFDHLT